MSPSTSAAHAASPQEVDLFGCSFHSLTEAEAIDLFYGWIDAPARRTRTVITVNVAILMMSREDAELRACIEKADLVVVDGKPLVWSSRWLGTPVPERVSGVDLMQRLLESGARRGLRVFLLGTTQERLEKLEAVIREKHPGVVIAGSRNGYFGRPDDEAVAKQIAASKADVLLVGMPAPFKEIWCEKHRDLLDTPVVLGVGGAFDVLGGFVQRAPKVVQDVGLEWFWRMMMEPKKLFRRYLVTNTKFIALLGRTVVLRKSA